MNMGDLVTLWMSVSMDDCCTKGDCIMFRGPPHIVSFDLPICRNVQRSHDPIQQNNEDKCECEHCVWVSDSKHAPWALKLYEQDLPGVEKMMTARMAATDRQVLIKYIRTAQRRLACFTHRISKSITRSMNCSRTHSLRLPCRLKTCLCSIDL